MEFFGTFFLMFTIYATAVHRKASPAVCAALIGLSLSMGIGAFGRVTGGAFNPVRALGPSIIAGEPFMRGFWIYFAGPFAGAVVAALGYEFLFSEGLGTYELFDKEEEEVQTI